MDQKNKKTKSKRKPGRPKAGLTKYNETIPELILKEKIKRPLMSKVEIAEKIGCHESVVRYHLRTKSELNEKINEAIKEYFKDQIFKLQEKAFYRLNHLLDDLNTPPQVIASVCKYLLEKWIVNEEIEKETNETIEFETIINENGSVQQTRRVIKNEEKIQDDSEDEIEIEWDEREKREESHDE